MADSDDIDDRADSGTVLREIRKELALLMSPSQYQAYMLATDKFGIFKQRRMRGVPVWRGHEWWMPQV